MTQYARNALGRCVFASALLLIASVVPALSQPIAISRVGLTRPADQVLVGTASFYDDPGETASGELYDPAAFTAAAQLELRDKFGGIKFGKDYQPVYAIAEYGGRRAILKFNDVGPLKPGRMFDLSRAAMEHFGGIEQGLLPDFKVTVLPAGEVYTPGPLSDEPANPPAPTDRWSNARVASGKPDEMIASP